MQIFEKPVIDITKFEVEDIIATSHEHDNSFGDFGDLVNA